MRAIEAILFDKDGTLMDFQASWGPWAASVIARICGEDTVLSDAVAQALGFDSMARRFHPDSAVIAGTPQEVLDLLGPFFPDASLETILSWLEPDPADFVPSPVAGLVETCGILQARGLRLGVVTNDFEAAGHDHLRQMGVADFFATVVGYDSGFGGKPEPGPCLGAADRLGVAAGACVMVGDSLHDLEAARRAGMIPVAVLTGVAGAEELSPHAEVVLETVAGLPGWLSGR
ncbi:phosphoglycolate phosphatase [Celeribacter persicus]|uniref:phosphoglycolate phosphatase n=2 Tax=Celeribacter persicus TaxID=1651082 RepID=A0A2T5HI69_9RHOB|nr:phosphoglycolate phosphatase [Celeribacter persicus]